MDSKASNKEFESLLKEITSHLETHAQSQPHYFPTRKGILLEDDILEIAKEASQGTRFAGTFKKGGTNEFPDLFTQDDFYGIEVKTSQSNNWRSVGNSVLETSRIQNIDNIYVLFGKIKTPSAFRWSRYEDCIYDVSVTHYPRYQIDMDTQETLFDKMGTKYDLIRNSDPVSHVKKYYREKLKPGEKLWWLDSEEHTTPISTKHFSDLDESEKDLWLAKSMAFMPEIFSPRKTLTKYKKVASLLMVEGGILCHNVRDHFSAGGQQEIKVEGKTYPSTPQVFSRLQNLILDIEAIILSTDKYKLEDYWECDLRDTNALYKWIDLVNKSSLEWDEIRKNGLDIQSLILEHIK